MENISTQIFCHWKTRAVSINGKIITISKFVYDLKRDEEEPGNNQDIIDECKGVKRFQWGDDSPGTNCLALACCFYVGVKWVMCRFFMRELTQAQQGDIRLNYDYATLKAGYLYSEELFAKEFTEHMDKFGAIPVNEESEDKQDN